jgi:hypothetical protein
MITQAMDGQQESRSKHAGSWVDGKDVLLSMQ